MRLNPATRLRVPALRERREDLPDLVRFAFLDALRSEPLRPLVRAYLARFPTPDDFAEEQNAVHVRKAAGALAAPRRLLGLPQPRGALQRLAAHAWPGNHRELRLLATNALVFSLVQHLDSEDSPPPQRRERAPAVLAIGEALIDRLLGKVSAQPPSAPGPVISGNSGDRRIEIALKPGGTLRRDLRRRRAPVPDGVVPRPRRRSRPDGRGAVRARRDPRARCTCA